MRKRWRYRGHGHFTMLRGWLTIYGTETAMHGAAEIKTPWGWLCFKPTTRSFGEVWPWYVYLSPDATPPAARWKFGARWKRRGCE